MSGAEISLYTDGGSKGGGAASGGCILVDGPTGKDLKIMIFLGQGTNNEAEICASLVGFSAIHALLQSGVLSSSSIRWVADSEYVLKSGTAYIKQWQRNGWKTASKDPVKNQGLWRAYLHLTRDFRIEPEHVRGHTGHEQNEACDAAANWAHDNALEIFASGGEGSAYEIDDTDLGAGWIMVDARDYLQLLRDPNPTERDSFFLRDKLRALGITDFASAAMGSLARPKPDNRSKRRALVGAKLKEAEKLCRGADDGDLAAIGDELGRLIGKL